MGHWAPYMTFLLIFSILFHSEMRDISFVNKVDNISRNPKVTAINSCLEVDITGQVVSDSIGTRMYSGEYIYYGITLVNQWLVATGLNFNPRVR
jgi:hypothetical protein